MLLTKYNFFKHSVVGISLTCPELPKQLSTIVMRRAFASLFTENSKNVFTYK